MWLFCITLAVIGTGLGCILAPANAQLLHELDSLGVDQHAGGFALLSVSSSLGFICGPLAIGIQHYTGFRWMCVIFGADTLLFGMPHLP